jgi:hypothetical protein
VVKSKANLLEHLIHGLHEVVVEDLVGFRHLLFIGLYQVTQFIHAKCLKHKVDIFH